MTPAADEDGLLAADPEAEPGRDRVLWHGPEPDPEDVAENIEPEPPPDVAAVTIECADFLAHQSFHRRTPTAWRCDACADLGLAAGSGPAGDDSWVPSA